MAPYDFFTYIGVTEHPYLLFREEHCCLGLESQKRHPPLVSPRLRTFWFLSPSSDFHPFRCFLPHTLGDQCPSPMHQETFIPYYYYFTTLLHLGPTLCLTVLSSLHWIVQVICLRNKGPRSCHQLVEDLRAYGSRHFFSWWPLVLTPDLFFTNR